MLIGGATGPRGGTAAGRSESREEGGNRQVGRGSVSVSAWEGRRIRVGMLGSEVRILKFGQSGRCPGG